MFNLKQLETFYWAAKLGSFTAAAERLNYTQSTVSMRIHDLEQDLGVSLFDRSQRTARITSKGRDLLKHAEELLNLSAEVHERIAAPGTRRGIVRLFEASVGATECRHERTKNVEQPRNVLGRVDIRPLHGKGTRVHN